ncbi:cellophane-induced protein 1-like 1 [Venturia nashicola]|uniref:Cellophane-induced protein 1-like 1 n=1 Tax=Venturia nashicola TaxID=86259 RepID=A0A4Z1PBL1_9PEZI|nr:cellophane-induced protein 1-like 1 [Venturia nashicola]
MRFTTFISLALAGFSLTNALVMPSLGNDVPKVDESIGGKHPAEKLPTGKELQKVFCEKLNTIAEAKECALNLKICRSTYQNKERKTVCEVGVMNKFSAPKKGKGN